MSDRLKKLREQRAKAVEEMRGITETATTEKRDLTGEELAKHDEIYKKQDGLRQQIEAEERSIEAQRQMAEQAGEAAEQRGGGNEGGVEERQMAAFRSFLGEGDLSGYRTPEMRALIAGSDQHGGMVTAPRQVAAGLLKRLDEMFWLREIATVHQLTKADSLGITSLEDDLDDAEWTSELRTGSDDDNLSFGGRELNPVPLAKRLKVSETLLRRSVIPLEKLLMDRLAHKFSRTQEKAYLLGDGKKKPLGMFVASNNGISTSRDVATGNTTTEVKFDGLINAKYTLKPKYWTKASWLFNGDVVKQIVKLKNNDGNYIWRESVKDGEPDTILGRPVRISEFAPNAMTAGSYVGLFGDYSFYHIATALDLNIKRLNELYAETNRIGFIGRLEEDAMPVLEEAFVRIQLPT